MTTDAFKSYYSDRGLTPLQPDPIQKLKLEANIVLGDFIFNTVDEDGIVWVVSDIEGWWSPPEVDVPVIERGFGDGAYDVSGRYTSREFTIVGSFLPPNPSLVEQARDKFVEACNLVYKGTWLKTGSSPIRASFVRLSSAVNINTVNARGRTDFSIPLRAADPIKYAWNSSHPDGYEVLEVPIKNTALGSTGEVTIINEGNYPVPILLDVVGPVSSPAYIYNQTTQEIITINQSLNSVSSTQPITKKLEFDFENLQDIATIETVTDHNLNVGDTVEISGVGEYFDGEFLVASVPDSNKFTYVTEAALVSSISTIRLENNVATIITTSSHGFNSGDTITVANTSPTFNGTHTVTVGSQTEFSYSALRDNTAEIASTVMEANRATITTVGPHQFLPGDEVTIEEVGKNYDGTYTIISTPLSTKFSYNTSRSTADPINQFSISSAGSEDDIVTFQTTSSEEHGYVVNESVTISGITDSTKSFLNGTYIIKSIGAAGTAAQNTFTVRYIRPSTVPITTRSLTNNVATIVTATEHGFLFNSNSAKSDWITVEGVGAPFDGDFSIQSVPSPTSLTYSATGADTPTGAVVSGAVRPHRRVIRSKARTSNVATIRTRRSHNLQVGDAFVIRNTSGFNDSSTVVSLVNATTFTYSSSGSNVNTTESSVGTVEIVGTIANTALSDGSATVGGSLPAAAASENSLATITSTDVSERASRGDAIKTNNVELTSNGIVSASVFRSSDIVEIDTQNRQVFFNGEVSGARDKIDVLADFIQLTPGENILQFSELVEGGLGSSQGLLRVYYRSGWLS